MIITTKIRVVSFARKNVCSGAPQLTFLFFVKKAKALNVDVVCVAGVF